MRNLWGVYILRARTAHGRVESIVCTFKKKNKNNVSVLTDRLEWSEQVWPLHKSPRDGCMDCWHHTFKATETKRKHQRPFLNRHVPKYLAVGIFLVWLVALPIIVRLVPVVEVDEQSVVDHSGDGGDADQGRVLPVHRLQLHPRSEPGWRHRLR